MGQVFLLGAGFSKCAGLPLNDELPSLITEAAFRSCQGNTHLKLGPHTSPKEAAEDSNYYYSLPAIYLTQIANAREGKSFDRYIACCTEFPSELSGEWKEALSNISSLRIRDVVDEAMKEVLEQTPKRTDYIDSLVSYCQRTGSPIYSTNFDTLIEQACTRMGYEADVAGTFSRGTDLPKASFRLHKINGSLDWQLGPDVLDVPLGEYPVRFERSIETMGAQKIALTPSDKLATMATAIPSLLQLHKDFRRYKKLVSIGSSFQDRHITSALYPCLFLPGYSMQVVAPSEELPLNIKQLAESLKKDWPRRGEVLAVDSYAHMYCNELGEAS